MDMEVTHTVHEKKKWRSLSWRWKHTKRRRPPMDPFFEEGDVVCSIAAKQLPLEEKEVLPLMVPEFVCSMTRCNKIFHSVGSYEVHYNSTHRNVCSTCGRSLPSSHLLNLHILESHDSMFEILVSKQNMYRCLVEECEEKFPSTKERKDHSIRVHHYPANFRFQPGRKGSRQRKSQRSADSGDAMQVEEMSSTRSQSDEVKENVKPMAPNDPSTLTSQTDRSAPSGRVFSYKVPQSISFGQGVSRGFHTRGKRGQRGRRGGRKPQHWHQQNVGMETDTTVDIEAVKMEDLASALDST